MEPKVSKNLDWETALKKPGLTCVVSGRQFEIGDDYVSFLRFDIDEGWQRADVAPECFDQLENSPFAFWRARVPEPEAKKKRPLDVNFLTEFFKRLNDPQVEESGVRDHRAVAYIVTLLLVRKKVLIQDGVVMLEGQEFLEVHFKKGEESKSHRVLVPELTAEKMEMIRDDLGRIFNLDDGDDSKACSQAQNDSADLMGHVMKDQSELPPLQQQSTTIEATAEEIS